MRTYSEIVGDGGSNVVGQITELTEKVAARFAGVRHVVAVGSGKGGVGKSTLTRHLAAVMARAGRRVGILDADLNGPSQAVLGGIRGVPLLPGERGGLALPRTADGIRVLSFGSLLADRQSLSWPSVAPDNAQTWRATREASSLVELLASAEWGELDVVLADLPPGPERTAQFAQLLGPSAAVVLVSIPSALAQGVVARSLDALRPLPNPILGYVENMSGYVCTGCGKLGELFPPESQGAGDLAPSESFACLGKIPFDPELARLCDQGIAITAVADDPFRQPTLAALAAAGETLWQRLEAAQ